MTSGIPGRWQYDRGFYVGNGWKHQDWRKNKLSEKLRCQKQTELKAILDGFRQDWLAERFPDFDYMRETCLTLARYLYSGGLRVKMSHKACDIGEAYTL